MVANRVPYKLAHRVQPEFSHNRGAMCFSGLYADPECASNFLVALPLRKQLNDLSFPSAWLLRIVGCNVWHLAPQKTLENYLREA